MTERRGDLGPETRPGRFGVAFAAIWLFYLLGPLAAGWSKRDTVAGWVGMLSVVAFSAVYLGVFVALRLRRQTGTAFRVQIGPVGAMVVLAVLVLLAVVTCVAVGQQGTTCTVYLGVASVLCLPTAAAWATAAAMAGASYAATALVPGWHSDGSIVFGTLVATLAVWGLQQALGRNIALVAVREENARLAVVDERNRFARDLHDILGHSLTVITVKAELASRLFDVDSERARQELADLERLSRDALADVRRAVAGYRDLTLPGELARARQALEAADIEARLPNSTDEVPTELRELFAWTVREGITNVVRHSGAARCTVRLHPDRVEIEDDGLGGGAAETPAGHGLLGLRERAAAADAVLVARSLDPHGFLLQVVAE